MQIKVKNIDGASILSLAGDFLGDDDHDKLRERVRELVKKKRTHLVLDLADVEHINSCGLGSLVCALTTVRRAGGELHLAGVGVHVGDILRLTHLNTVFQIYPSVSAARRASAN
jgi:anti-sigma B factor antagonist